MQVGKYNDRINTYIIFDFFMLYPSINTMLKFIMVLFILSYRLIIIR